MEIREIFENRIKIEPKVMSIESLFNNIDRVNNTNYKPSYQRNYVWDDEKATYFIESILLGTEIPPLIFFRNIDKVEVIDGRQRYQTILRFINNQFKLRKNGLQKLDNIGIANKSFKDMGMELQDLLWDTKLRIIEFSFHSQNLIDEEIEEIVKKEIFRRYNSGITPLKTTDIDNAVYIGDDLNTFFKHRLQNDKIFSRNVANVLHFEKSSTEIILKKIRQMLVQHQIPIRYYAIKKDTVISKYYEFLFASADAEDIQEVFTKFIEKLNLLNRIKNTFPNKGTAYNRMMSECLFWVFSILENEQLSLNIITKEVLQELVDYLVINQDAFGMARSSFLNEITTRYTVTADFFVEKFKIDFHIYLQNNNDFKQKNKDITPIDEERISFDELRINKPEPSSIAIMDICRQMERQRFLIRPPYQRNEVINKKKSSSIIESILLGIKLPPIFVYKRKDEVSEVLDGQQRLLSILGFIKKPYLDENNKIRHSDKDGYSLNLKNSILKNLNGKKFDQLSLEQQEKIKNFDLWIIEISYKNNINFEPIDLFIRLNNKPYPIKEDTFEMWNSYISRDIIETIKSIHKNHSDWFYIRKNNSRMEDENIYTTLSYFQSSWNRANKPTNYFPKELDMYKVLNKINFRVKSKNEVSKLLEDTETKQGFIKAANDLEFNFITKLKLLLSDENDSTSVIINKNLDGIFKIENGKRTQQGFYALWYFLFDIPFDIIQEKKHFIREDLKSLFLKMTEVESKQDFDAAIAAFKLKYTQDSSSEEKATNDSKNHINLGDIVHIYQGLNFNGVTKSNILNPKTLYPYLRKGEFKDLQINSDDITYIDNNEKGLNKEFFDARGKILLKRSITSDARFSVAFYDQKLAFSVDTYGIIANRGGFLPKFILAFMASRYCFNKYYNQFYISPTEELKPLVLADIKAIQIPYLNLDDQNIFAVLVDYTLNSNFSGHISLFFIRLIDAIIYENRFSDQFKIFNIQIMEYLKDLQPLNTTDVNNYQQIVTTAYNVLSSPSHALSGSLLKLLNISEVQLIEQSL